MVTRVAPPVNYLSNTGKVVANFANSDTWTFSGTGNAGAMTSDIRYPGHDRGARLVCGAGAGTICQVNRTVTTTKLTADGTFILAFYAETWSATDNIRILLFDGTNSPDGVFDAFGQVREGWNYVTIPASVFSPALGGLDQTLCRVRLTSANGGSSVVVGGIWYDKRSRPKVILEFDDAFLSQYTEAYAYMQPRGIPGTVSIIERTVGKSAGQVDTHDYCSKAQLDTMYANGWDMTVHGYYNHSSDLANNLASITADVALNKRYVKSCGWGRAVNHYVYPGGIAVSSSILALSANDMATGRTTLGRTMPVAIGIDQPYKIWSYQISAAAGLALIKTIVDYAIHNGCTIRLYGHRITASIVENTNEILIADFRALIDYIALKRNQGLIDAVTVSEWYAGLSHPRRLQ